jgi:hypothetical protein
VLGRRVLAKRSAACTSSAGSELSSVSCGVVEARIWVTWSSREREPLKELSEVSAVPRASRKRRTRVCVSGRVEVGGIESTSQVVQGNGVVADPELRHGAALIERDPGPPEAFKEHL